MEIGGHIYRNFSPDCNIGYIWIYILFNFYILPKILKTRVLYLFIIFVDLDNLKEEDAKEEGETFIKSTTKSESVESCKLYQDGPQTGH